MAKFRKDDLKLIVKELVRESLLEILAEEFIEETTFRAVESASSQIVGTVTKQINSQLAPIMEHIKRGAVGAPPVRAQATANADAYIQTLDDDYGSVSVAESLGLTDISTDTNAMDSIIANVRGQMQSERDSLRESEPAVTASSQLGFGEEKPAPKSDSTLGAFGHLIQSSAETLSEQRSAAQSVVGPDMFNISSTKGAVAQADKTADPNYFKSIVDKVNSRRSSSPILGPQLAKAQQAHSQAQALRMDKADLDRPAHEVSNYAKASI